MKNILLFGLSLLSFAAISQNQVGQLTITKENQLTPPSQEIIQPDLLPVIIQIEETEERIFTKKKYARITIITSEIKEEG